MERSEEKTEERASVLYRLKVQRIEEERPVDLDWRADVLYAQPRAYPSKRKKYYYIQINTDNVHVVDIAYITDKTEAKQKYSEVKKDLNRLTKNEFDIKYGIGSENIDENIDENDAGEVIIRIDKKEVDEAFDEAMLFAGEKRVNPSNA